MLSDKKLTKIEGILGKDVTDTMDALDVTGLQTQVCQSEANIKEAQEELEANQKYQELKENLKALTSGLREVKKFQRARIDYAMHLLEVSDSESLEDSALNPDGN